MITCNGTGFGCEVSFINGHKKTWQLFLSKTGQQLKCSIFFTLQWDAPIEDTQSLYCT